MCTCTVRHREQLEEGGLLEMGSSDMGDPISEVVYIHTVDCVVGSFKLLLTVCGKATHLCPAEAGLYKQ